MQKILVLLLMLGLLNSPSSRAQKIVFMGNSITAGWKLTDSFPGKDYINKGMSGQITSQFLERFQADVLALQPNAVVILGGTNDISRSIPVDTIFKNIVKMAMKADEQHIQVILSSVLPVSSYACCDGFSAKPLILLLNSKLENFAKTMGFRYLDYYSSVVDNEGGLTKAYTFDGVHMKVEGYQVMTKVANKILKEIH